MEYYSVMKRKKGEKKDWYIQKGWISKHDEWKKPNLKQQTLYKAKLEQAKLIYGYLIQNCITSEGGSGGKKNREGTQGDCRHGKV